MHCTITRPVHQVNTFIYLHFFPVDLSLYINSQFTCSTHRILDQRLLMLKCIATNKILGPVHEQCCHLTSPLPINRTSNLSVVWFTHQELRQIKHQNIQAFKLKYYIPSIVNTFKLIWSLATRQSCDPNNNISYYQETFYQKGLHVALFIVSKTRK